MNFQTFDIAGPVAIQPVRHGDARGYFAETFRADRFIETVGKPEFVQENESLSAKAGTIRGLHFQTDPFAQGKLVRCIAGALLDVAVDIRTGSPTYGKWLAIELSAENGRQLWVPPGFAHGFCTLVPDTMLAYKVTAYYDHASDKGLAWDDSAIGIKWPAVADPDTLSPKDRVQPTLADLPAYFTYQD
ncbi:dTDP-4-dehydrorhamnose 3,5-epimerase [Sphingomonas sp. Leaf357]|uniref:dTDP-4-dehydrorhamnose 3,5-epimerase n=1 Tax=Sphingomonas sp. Leaf357 TaxID=1736350 RepID=UPI0006F312B4|nr:dTDP-4-dehydrorhamnose 3,5-epimerase [Sphingomonas sp. Leaf357]KQS03413.1 dTDP-4-dehydrorhamnose 3,5-epimerase [Sphingomonas sp. Leaf357]